MKFKFGLVGLIILLVGIWGIQGAGAEIAGYVTPSVGQPNYQTMYSSTDMSNYWPILSGADAKEQCQARQDILLQVAPLGCAPTVVRSDLLADQNVPVFCQIDALKINPLLEIGAIKSIGFTGKYPKEVVDVGFHPAKAALISSLSQPLPDPLLNNAGYVVVILKRNQNESSLPDFITLNLTANIDYTAGNSLGVGNAEFKLRQLSDSDWESFGKAKSSFWGRYSLKLESATDNLAKVSLYAGDRKITTVEVAKGQRSSEIYMSGDYCQNSLQLEYRGFEADAKRATIDVDGDKLEVYEKSKFLNDKCQIDAITVNPGGGTGTLKGHCPLKSFELSIVGKGGGFEYDYWTTLTGLEKRNGLYFVEEQRESGASYLLYRYVLYNPNKKLKIFYNNERIDYIYANAGSIFLTVTNSAGGSEDVEIGRIENFAVRMFPDKKQLFENGVIKPDIKGVFDLMDGASIVGSAIVPKGVAPIGDKSLGAENDKAFSDTINAYKKVAEDYRTAADSTGKKIWGEMAMQEAIVLAREAGKAATEIELINKYLSMYPEANATQGDDYRRRIDQLQTKDFSKSTVSVELDNSLRSISLVDLSEPSKKVSAEFSIGGVRVNVNEGTTDTRSVPGVSLTLEKVIDANNVRVSCATYSVKLANTINTNIRSETTSPSQTTITKQLTVNSDGFTCGTYFVKLNKVEMDTLASVGVIPSAKGTRTQTNLAVKIGIEKRAIQLSPEKTKEMINNLNKSIDKFSSISKTLGNVVKGLQGTCLATGTILTVSNFFTGLGGESIARQEVMRGANGWTKRCKDIIAGTKTTMSECFAENSNKIESDVAATAKAITTVNTNIDNIEKLSGVVTSSDLFGKTINTNTAKLQLANNLKRDYPGSKIGNIPIETALSPENVDSLSYNELREINLNLERRKLSGFSDGTMLGIEQELNASATRIAELQKGREEAQKLNAPGNGIAPLSFPVGNAMTMAVLPNSGIVDEEIRNAVELSGATHHSSISLAGKIYILGLKATGTQNQYQITGAVPIVDGSRDTPVSDINKFILENKLGNGIVTPQASVSLSNKMTGTVEIVFYDTGQYKGLPHVVPFDRALGWYAATKATLPASGAQGAFDLSGKVTSFWLCNVMKNGKIEFDESGFGDDECRQVNVNTGATTGAFPGLSESDARKKVQQATDAITAAARNYGKSTITIGNDNFKVGKPAALISEMQCEDFMSASSCTLLYNVCDPVICPSSRCDLGGRYPVKDVVQSGLIGSTLLCLPNFGNPSKGGVVIPVCLTGIQAGLDGYISILKNHRDCLQENLNTGRVTGLCDQMYSFYKCDLLWKQVVPFATTLIPNLVGAAYGQSNVRGGGEYGTVTAAWENSRKSFNFFTQQYAGNLMKAFQAQSVEDIGVEFCKAYISASVPTSFGGLVEPQSPPQFHGWFSSSSYSTATVPATAQYKAFYHIFAGNNAGAFYSVYLKNPPESSYYGTQQTIQITSGFVQKGQYATDTKDFTAPEGYKQMCIRVNQQEECGFGEVSTSFAVNQLSDLYVSDQAKEQITTESECSSGTRSFETAAVNTNLQSAIQEGLNPEIYKRGIVRICATSNPGSSTDATRYVDVGFCGDQRVRCWLDKNSVQNAIKDLGTRNETLTQLEDSARQKLIQSGAILSPVDIASEIKKLYDGLADVKDTTKTPDAQLRQKAASLILNAEAVLTKAYLNGDKAQILLFEARVLENLFSRNLIAILESALNTITPQEQKKLETLQPEAAQPYKEFYPLRLSKDYSPGESISIENNRGEVLNITIDGGKIYLTRPANKQIGSVTQEDDKTVLNVLSSYINELDEIEPTLFYYLNGYIDPADKRTIKLFEAPKNEISLSKNFVYGSSEALSITLNGVKLDEIYVGSNNVYVNYQNRLESAATISAAGAIKITSGKSYLLESVKSGLSDLLQNSVIVNNQIVKFLVSYNPSRPGYGTIMLGHDTIFNIEPLTGSANEVSALYLWSGFTAKSVGDISYDNVISLYSGFKNETNRDNPNLFDLLNDAKIEGNNIIVSS